jgi:exodeoxyribonuclease VII small subunit
MNKPNQTYRELNDELDNIMLELQSGELDIDLAVEKYERGMQILKKLETYLTTAENKVKLIKNNFDQS